VLKPGKPTPSGNSPCAPAIRRSRGWNASSTRCAPNWLKWHLLTAYDRLLRRVALATMAVAYGALNRRKRLGLPPRHSRGLNTEERLALMRLGIEPVDRSAVS